MSQITPVILVGGSGKRLWPLSREKYPDSKIFGLTTGLAVMKINSKLGYEPVTYSELTTDEEFWKGCRSCVNYEILMSKERKNCMCTAMLFDPAEAQAKAPPQFRIVQQGKFPLFPDVPVLHDNDPVGHVGQQEPQGPFRLLPADGRLHREGLRRWQDSRQLLQA